MKVMQYTTKENNFMFTQEITPACGQVGGAITVNIENTICLDSFKGFGVALTGSSCYELSLMDTVQRKDFLESIYGEKWLNLSVGRLSIGSSDYSKELYSYDDVAEDTKLEHFSVSKDESYILPMIKEVIKTRPDISLFASPWSPPGWMKTGGEMCGGYMRSMYIDSYADYIVKFIEEYEKHGIRIEAVTPQNEPETAQNAKMPACIWHPDIESEFVLKLRQKFMEKNIDTQIWLFDHNFNGWQRVLWCLKQYPKLLSACDAVAFHYYNGNVEMLENIRKEYPQLQFHFTEGGPRLYDNYDCDWCKWGIMMAKALNAGCSTFTGWNLLLNENGGPNIGPFFCGGLATLNSQTKDITYSGQYRAFEHFSKFIKKDATIYATATSPDTDGMFTFPNLPMTVTTCAAKNANGTFVLEIINPNSSKKQLQFFYNNNWWYVEALPNTVNTFVSNGEC